MARRALLFEDGVRRGHAATAVYTSIFVERVPGNPYYRQDRYEKTQPELDPFQRSRSLEIIEIDALREFLGGACSSHVILPTAGRGAPIAHALFQKIINLILQCHHGVHGAQYNQSQRNGNVHEQPEMKPVVQTLLLLKLSRFFAYILQIVDGGMCARREQRAQA